MRLPESDHVRRTLLASRENACQIGRTIAVRDAMMHTGFGTKDDPQYTAIQIIALKRNNDSRSSMKSIAMPIL